MPNTKISALSHGNPAQSGDEFPIARSGSNYYLTVADLFASPTFTGTATASTLGVLSVLSVPSYSSGSAASNTTAGTIAVGSAGVSNLGVGDGTNTRTIPLVLYKGMSFAATGNVTSYSTVLGTPTYSSGSLTTVANQLVVGSVLRIKAQGTMTISTAAMTIGFEILLGGVAVWAGTVASVATTANAWSLEGEIYVSATGASGTAAFRSTMECSLFEDNTYSTALPCAVITGALQSVTTGIATTGTNAVDVRMEFGTSETSNTCQCTMATVELL